MISNQTRKIKETPSKFKERKKITKIKDRRSRLKMYLREKIWTTNLTATRKNLSCKRNITSKDLPILILLLTKSMAEENKKKNRAPRCISFKPNSKTCPRRIDQIFFTMPGLSTKYLGNKFTRAVQLWFQIRPNFCGTRN